MLIIVNDNTYYFFLGTICGGGSKTIFIKAKVTNCAPDTITNTAEIYHFIGTDDDSDDNIATCTTYVICPDPSIEIEKKIWNGTAWVNPLEIDSGEIMLFNLSIYNSGNEALKNINITDYLPDGLEYVEGSATIEPIQWGHNLTWLLYGCHCCHEGLSHGYWKTHTDEWHFYCTDTCLNDIFDIPDEFSIGDDSFLDALNFGGGSDLEDAAKLLLQQAVAALLNAVGDEINYPLNVTEIINQVDDALDSMDRDTILDLKDLLDEYNNLGCCDDSEDCNGCCHCDCKFLPGEHIHIEFEAIAEGCEENINLVVAKGEGKCSHVEVIDNDTADIFIVCNHPPVANDDYATIYEDSVNNSIDVLANDSDIDGDELAIISMTAPSHGTAYIDGGMIYYTPDENYYGSDEFNYTISDGFATDAATVYITILPVNDAPVANDDYYTTDEDVALVMDILTNDTDIDGFIVPDSIQIVSYPSHGSLIVNPNGTVKYTPNENYDGDDEFSYTVEDNDGAVSNVANVYITVLSVNDPPVALNDSATTDEDTPVWIDILANDYDIDGTIDASTISIINGPFHGSIIINYTTGEVKYIPNANYNGEDSFNYTVKDNEGAVSNIAEVIILIGTENDFPVAKDDYITVEEGNSANLLDDGNDSVLDNDYDVDGDILQASLITPPSHGSLTLNPDGTFVYTHNGSETTSDFFVYSASDGIATDTATVHITILPVNDPPVALNDSATTDEDKAVFINVSMNDYDVDGTIDLGSIVIVDYPSHGSLEIYANGTVKYIPNADYHGDDEFNYTIKDNDGAVSNVATVFITVSPVNDPPVANDDYAIVEEDSSGNQIDVLANDTDMDGDSLEIISVSSPLHGTVYHDGNYVYYTPDANYYGDDSFTYTITDGIATDTATVYVTILAINDSPIANDDYVITNEDTPVVIDVLANDTDVEDGVPELNAIISQPSHGIATINPNGTITYEPNANYYGEDSFIYEVIDSDGATDTATVYITVIATPKPIINIEKIDYPDPVKAGEILQYVINVSNSGDADANSLTISDDYDETLLQIVNFTSGGFNDGNKIIWTNVAIPAHSYKLFFINATVNKDISNGTIIYNTANYSYNEGSGEITEETTVLAYEIEDPKIAIDLNGAPLVPRDELE